MKILYLESKRKFEQNSDLNLDSLTKEIKEIFLAYSIQYKNQAERVKKILESHNIKVKGFQQVLGCTRLKTKLPIILIGSGKFHALNLALQNNTQVYIYNNSCLTEIDQKELEKLKQNTKLALNRFFSSNKIGILISTKPGQENMNKAEQLKEKIQSKYPEKKVYLLISNHININEFENFNIDLFINTACPGLLNDSPKILNLDDIISFL